MSPRFPFLLAAVAVVAGACSCSSVPGSPDAVAPRAPASVAAPRPAPPRARTLSIVSLNDLHGRIEALPLFAGYVANLRAARAADGGGVVVLDGGDMFQGTLESNLGEGAAVVDAYAVIGFDAVAVGNHEFDFGPVGPRATPGAPGDDPRGALFAQAARAPFPFLVANLRRAGGQPLAAKNLTQAAVLEVAGVRVGVVGLTTADVLSTTIAANVRDLEVEPLPAALGREAARLRSGGAHVVVAVAHAGGKCAHFTGDVGVDHCETASEAFDLARALPPGAVDAIVGGHTHQGVAHVVAGIPIIEAYSYGTHVGRIDLVLEGDPPRVVAGTPHPPRELCPGQPKDPAWATCDAGSYEGRPVQRDAEVAAAIAPHLERASVKKAERVGVTIEGGEVRRAYDRESALGNLVADLLLAHRNGGRTSGTTVAFMNGGGLRADLPGGDLRYGQLFEAFPFDNRLATAKVTGREVAAILARNLRSSGGILSVAGVTASARCAGGGLEVELRVGGKVLAPDAQVTIIASDFLLTGGDAFWGDAKPPAIEDSPELMRDALESELKKRGRVSWRASYDPERPRLTLPDKRPLRCPPG